ncbi:MAG: di-heme oxidoredictase family protein [Hyphomicrobium sp.]|uniref:di-heme oxidoredictase family protein n=1 Tax=Hyphomicrobium sp. TaxID=82 RepID=UPI0039E410AA
MTRRSAIALALSLIASINSEAAIADPLDAAVGKALFDRQWIPAPSSTDGTDGLGPLFVSRSCTGCHARGEGAHVITRDDGITDIKGAVLRFGTADGATDPYYGLELQPNAVPGLLPEGSVSYLPELHYKLNGPALAKGVHAGVRLAPPLFGKAAFDDVADEEILRRADANARAGGAIKGRANVTPHGIGRYGWKAAHVSLEEQVAHAFAFDIGMSSQAFPLPYGDCTARETECLSMPNGESPLFQGRELSAAMVGVVASYLKTLKPRPATEASALFQATGCAACHAPTLTTRDGRNIPAFTDLLLHDMGPSLDDGVGEPGVKSFEWRTAPLINHGLPVEKRRYLHDGSAATVEEAVAKHCGEAEDSRVRFEALTGDDKKRLVDYVNGL